jgi:type IV secretion system protein VirD4
LSCGNSAIVHDPKGELLAKTGPRRSQFSKIIVFAPGEKGSMRWNPLSKSELPKDWEDKQVTVGRISQSLFVAKASGGGKSGDDYFAQAARAMFNFWALYLIFTKGETSFGEILKSALDGDPQELIAQALDSRSDLPERIRLEGQPLLAKGTNEFGSVLGTFQTSMEVFLDARVSRNVSATDFSLWDLRKEPTTIFLKVANTDQARLKPILSLFFEVATLTALDHEPGPDELSITLFLDEFVRLSRMQEVLNMPAIGRSYRLNAIYVCQSISQIVDIYGKAGADQLKNTCSFHVFFAQNEFQVAQDISNSIGNRTRKKRSYSSGGKGLFRTSNESDEGVPLIRPQEIMSLKVGRVLICRQNAFETPLDARSAFWFKDKALFSLVPKDAAAFNPLAVPDQEEPAQVVAESAPIEPAPAPVVAVESPAGDVVPEAPPAITAEPEPEPEELAPVAAAIFAAPVTEDEEANEPEEDAGENPHSGSSAAPIISSVPEQSTSAPGVVARCSACGRSFSYAGRVGRPCMTMQGDGSLCEGVLEAVEDQAA